LFKIPFIKQFNDKIELMLKVYESNKGIKQQYYTGNTKVLLKANTTRWNSIYTSYQSIISVKSHLIDIAERLHHTQEIQMSTEEWNMLDDMLFILEVFKIITDKIQKDSATLYHVWEAFRDMTTSILTPDRIKRYKTVEMLSYNWTSFAQDSISKRYTHNIANEAVKLVDVFTTSNNRIFLSSTVYDNTQKLLESSGVSIVKRCTDTTLDDHIIRDRIRSQYNRYQQTKEPFHMTPLESQSQSGNEYNDALSYWIRRNGLEDSKELSVIALAYLHINPSEASVERAFSRQKYVHTALRNRLHKETIDAMMFIKMNSSAMELIDDGMIDNIYSAESIYDTV